MARFSLDPRLEADTYLLADLERMQILLFDTQQFPWLVVVPKKPEAVEITDLSREEHLLLQQDIYALSSKMQAIFKADKMNIATLGNMVPQLHFHIIARKKDDACFPKPVWGNFSKIPYDEKSLALMLDKIRPCHDKILFS